MEQLGWIAFVLVFLFGLMTVGGAVFIRHYAFSDSSIDVFFWILFVSMSGTLSFLILLGGYNFVLYALTVMTWFQVGLGAIGLLGGAIPLTIFYRKSLLTKGKDLLQSKKQELLED